ncbi:glycosyl transferase family 90 [uncultured Vibrio sp.]|uniref:glycosyl transferase family 90 n=1 Tax=uncultured Vibrio sp. TaxID=114054 RepID=UPI0026062C52|nr:glycosyl transferase family 90 [uncultured Vibrio sp.]
MKKLNYYLSSLLWRLTPSFILREVTKSKLKCSQKHSKKAPNQDEWNYIQERVSYYNKLMQAFTPDVRSHFSSVRGFKKTGGSAYYFDLLKVIKGFSPSLTFNYINGDVVDVPCTPSFLKSRPIEGDNQNSVLLKLNAVRHYLFVDDNIPYAEKKDHIVWRGTGFRPNRRTLLETLFDHPRCNIGRIDSQDRDQLHYILPKMSIEEQLQYKFILSLEGKDVATNLKWIMSSNSLCFTPKLKYETWFMEGKLKAGIHFVEVKDDFSDLIQKMDYYLEHPDQAQAIINNANQWVEQFKDPKRERLISLLVAKKYFEKSGQM